MGDHGPAHRRERCPKTLAECARTRARRKIPSCARQWRAQFFTCWHASLLRSILTRIDAITAEIGQLSQVIEELLAPYEEQPTQAESMPGWGRRAAQDVIAQTGTDMTRVPHRRPPGLSLDKQSGDRAGQRRHKRGNKYITAVLGETAVAAGKPRPAKVRGRREFVGRP